jgi:hypothetical protein
MKTRFTLTFFSLLMSLFLAVPSFSQDTIPRPPKKLKKENIFDRMSFGGYLGAQFGDVTMINIAPMVDIELIPKLNIGVGFSYQFYKDNYYNYRFNAYGGNFYARYFIWRDLFAHVEYDPIYYDNLYTGFGYEGVWFNDFLVGGGYRQWIGDKAFMTIMILWNVNEQYYSPYQNPVIRIGFGAGI